MPLLQFPLRWPRRFVFVASVAATAVGVYLGRETGGSPALRVRAGTGSGEPLRAVSQAVAPVESSGSSASDWDARWHELLAAAGSARRDRQRLALLEELARTDPRRALALAAAESHWDLRDDLRDAALRGWGATAPEAAAEWAMALRLEERFRAVSAVLAGAAEQPDQALPLALKLCAADPEPAALYGHTLVSALVENGEFAAATHFAAAAKMIDTQAHILDSAYFQWARHQPEQAHAALGAMPESAARTAALQGVLEGWTSANPQRLVDYAQKLPAGAERTQAFNTVLPRWVEMDPVAATAWLNGAEPSPELDEGLAAVANSPSLVARQPRAALDWADSIADPVKRRMAKHDVFYEWAQRDLAAAAQFAGSVKNADELAMMQQVIDLVKGRG